MSTEPRSVARSAADLAYGPLPSHRLDLHVPDGARGALPVVVYVHGGGWMTGSRAWLREQAGLSALTDLLHGEGWAVAAVDYRLSGEAVFPAAVDDVVAAVEWVHHAAPGLGLDPDRIVLAGDSAGGHLALLASCRLAGTAAGRAVRAVLSYYGVPDLAVAVVERKRRVAESVPIRGFWLDHLVHAPTPEGRFLGVEPDLPEAAEVAQASSACAAAGPASPPALLLAGRYDPVAGTEGSQEYAARLRAAGVDARCVLVEAGHGEECFFTDPLLQKEVLDFLAVHAGPARPAGHDRSRFDVELPGLTGEGGTLRTTLRAMGDHTFDVDRYIGSEQGRHFLEHNVLLDHSDGMSASVQEFWRRHGKGLVKSLHDADGEAPWYSYVPVSAEHDPERRYPLLLQVNRKSDLVAETYGHVFEAARDEVIVVIPQARAAMPGFVKDFAKPVYGDGPRELPPTDDLWDVLQRAVAELPVDPARIYVTGFSFPGFRAVGLALRHPETIAAVLLNAHLYPFIWDLPGGELLRRASELHLPLVNIAGLCDYGHPYPVHHEQFEETNNGHDHDRSAQQALDHANLWFAVNGSRPFGLAEALATADLGDDRAAERTIGVPSVDAATLVLDDTAHHFVDVRSEDGVPRTRLVAIENCPHWPHGTFARLGWNFVRHFSRDPATGRSIWDGVEEPFAPAAPNIVVGSVGRSGG